ncbi:MAG: hypothetical protein JOY64_03565 [Alphaproteobacteria bacterium]|nr:hypothetical protein [Alphaproteobacteria bacterium]MBV8406683.1 hypothetical protein [Alphaproteobacteria bacterium]
MPVAERLTRAVEKLTGIRRRSARGQLVAPQVRHAWRGGICPEAARA